MTAIITASRWSAIHADYKTGSPTNGTARILRLTNDKGSVLVPAEIVNRERLFALSPVVATPGALAALLRIGNNAGRFLARHAQGDWGDLCDEDHDMNDQAVRSGERILSAYEVGTTRV